MKLAVLLFLLQVASLAQSNSDYEMTCRSEVARRLSVPIDRIGTEMSRSQSGATRVQWKTEDRRNGYCVIDNRMQVTEFQDFSQGGNNFNINGQPVTGFPRVSVDTSGSGDFNGGNMTAHVTRGWVDTRGQPNISLGGDNNFKISFRGEIIRANGDREFTIRIEASDKGSATGTATFRLNSDKNEVEFINVNGRLNGRPFNGVFNRN